MSALRTMQIATPSASGLWPLASGTHWSSSTLQLEADRVGIRWAGHGFLLMGTADMLPLSFSAAAGGRWRWVLTAQCSAKKSPTFRTAHGFLTCLVLADLFERGVLLACLATTYGKLRAALFVLVK